MSLCTLACTGLGLGFCGLLTQVILLRELLLLNGGMELAIGVFYAMWFSGVVLGAWIGRHWPSATELSVTLAALWLVASSVGGVLLTRLAPPMLGAVPGFEPPATQILLPAALGVVPAGTAIGLVFPLTCRWLGTSHLGTGAITGLYVWESVGFLIAAVLFTWTLAARMAPLPCLGLGGVVGLALSGPVGSGRWGTLALAMVSLALAAESLGGWMDSQSNLALHRHLAPDQRIVDHRLTVAEPLALTEFEGQHSLFRSGRITGSFPDPLFAEMTIFPLMAQHPEAERVLLLGGIEEGLVRAALCWPVEHLTVVEPNPDLISFLLPHLPPEDRVALGSERVVAVRDDPRHFLSRCEPGSFDLILCHLPEPHTLAQSRCHTVGFARQARRALAPDGMLAIGIGGYVDLAAEIPGQYAGAELATLQSVFSNVLLIPGERVTLLASDTAERPTGDIGRLSDAWGAANHPPGSLSPDYLRLVLEPDEVAHANRAVRLHAAEIPPSTDDLPLIHLRSLAHWDALSGLGIGTWLSLTGSLRIWHLALAALASLLIAVVWRRRRDQRAAQIAVSVGLSGAVGMTLSLSTLLLWQIAHGSLWEEIGLVIATFMVGLALGGGIAGRSRWSMRSCLSAQGLLALALGLAIQTGGITALIALPEFASRALLLLAVALAGVSTGSVFTRAAASLAPTPDDLQRVSGTLHAADHLGALIASITGPLLIMPALGLSVGLITAAGAAGLATLLISQREASL
jgi:spermidine synthase